MTHCSCAARARFVRSLTFLSLLLCVVHSRPQEIPPRNFTVQITASVQEAPAQIVLNWPDEGDATSYEISRRTLASGWTQIGSIPGGAISFTDADVAVGTPYEYKIVKTTPFTYAGYGYLRAGIQVPATDQRGTIILVVETGVAGALISELDLLQRDLTGDRWLVIRRDVAINDTAAAVKDQIKSIYDSDPTNVKAIFLFGHVPVAYSGDIAPDGHANHRGAWPADVYYGDMDGIWTDNTVNTTTAERETNHNIPGDGKFDQSVIPSDIELMVGRVDLHDMTCYANKSNARSEVDLLRQYLNKNHTFRTGQLPVERRALMCDNFGDKGRDRIGGSGWRTFPGAVGSDIREVGFGEYFPTASSESYLWSYGSGGGSYYYSTGIGTSDDFALNEVRVVFTMFTGSYFGDWNNESNFLRAALGSGSILTATYSGFPHTHYFPMSLGEPIGHCIRISQNNGQGGLYPPWGQGTRQIHVSLQGDPTLRLHPVKPAANLSASVFDGRAHLSWEASGDNDLQGYQIYRALSPEGPFTRLTEQPVSSTTFSDSPAPAVYTYMVRAVKLEQTPSGTYFNPSAGTFVSANISGTPIGNQLQLFARPSSQTELLIEVSGNRGQRFRLESSNDFVEWTVAVEATLVDSSIELSVTINRWDPGIFLRAVTLP
jgi:hypothetical protein